MSHLRASAEFNDFKDIDLGISSVITLNSRVDRFLISEEGQRFKMMYEPRSRVDRNGDIRTRWVLRDKFINFQYKGSISSVNLLNNRERNAIIKYLRFGNLPADIVGSKLAKKSNNDRPKDKAIRYGEADNPGPGRGRRRQRRRRAGNGFPRQLQMRSASVPIRGLPYQIFGSTGAPTSGGLNSEESGATLSNATSVILDPFAIGGRFNVIAQNFLQYRIKKAVLRFRPENTASGVQPNTGSGLTSPVYSNRVFVYGVSKDPDFVPNSFDNATDFGGHVTNVTRLSSVPVPPTGWRYVDTPASPTAADVRQCGFGALFFWFNGPTTAATPIYGYIEFDGIVQFRGAKDNTQVADPAPAIERYIEQNKERYTIVRQLSSEKVYGSKDEKKKNL